MHFYQTVELPGLQFRLLLDLLARGNGHEEIGGDVGGRGEEGGGGGDGSCDAQGGEVRVGAAETEQVAEIAEVVEGFVGIFDGEFAHVWGVGEVGVHCVVQLLPVPRGLEGREDEELGEAFAAGEVEGRGNVIGVCGRGEVVGEGCRGGWEEVEDGLGGVLEGVEVGLGRVVAVGEGEDAVGGAVAEEGVG